MEVPPLPESGSRPYNPSNAQLFAMFDIHGARERHQSARLAETQQRLEFMEIQGVPHRTIPMRMQDPGTVTLVLMVPDLDRMLDRSTRAGAEIVTPGGAVAMANGRSAIVRDPDGRFIELREAVARGGVDISDMRPSIAVADLAHTVATYRDILGFEVEYLETATQATQLRELTGLSSATFLRARIRAPGSALWIELVEYDDADREPLTMRIQDRGAARLQIRAENVVPLVEKMLNAGFAVVSEGGGPVPIPPNFMGALVADPNNFFLTPFAPCEGCAPGLVGE
jgi:predicted enzyme related to lactoylglutathione lyase/catechol 2,3-dioxygenase-like lactoylglutathione lyase family enzyme